MICHFHSLFYYTFYSSLWDRIGALIQISVFAVVSKFVLQTKDLDNSFRKDLLKSHITRRTPKDLKKEERGKKNKSEGERKD
jgi:hypothetical protein